MNSEVASVISCRYKRFFIILKIDKMMSIYLIYLSSYYATKGIFKYIYYLISH